MLSVVVTKEEFKVIPDFWLNISTEILLNISGFEVWPCLCLFFPHNRVIMLKATEENSV